MLISDIISRIRADLDDDRTAAYITVSLLDRIRTELNDTAGSGTAVNILNEVRKILGDESTRTGTPVSLASIRAELNDTADITSASTDSVIPSVRAKLGDPADSVLGTTTAASVTADSVIHYAQWSTSGSVTGTNAAINSSVNVASSSGSLSAYAEDGIKTIKGMRPDALINGNLPGGFQNALNLYVLARCLEGEVETEVGSAGYRTFYDRFEKEVTAVPPHISDAVLAGFLAAGTTEITARRPDLGNVICTATLSALEDFVMAQAAQSKLGTAAQPNLTAFYQFLDSIPYHYSDAELNQYIADGNAAVKAIRADADSMIDCFSDAVKSYAVCHAMGRRFGKDAEASSIWQAHDANFKAVVAAVPYHWTDAELNAFIADGETLITVRRPDLSGTAAASIDKMHYTVFSAIERRIGKDENAAALHKTHYEQFYSDLDNLPHHWTDAELTGFQTEAIQTVSSLRDDLVSNGQIRSDLIPALLFCISSLANNFHKDAASRNLSDAQWTKLVNLVKSLPYHWSDDELLNQLHDSIRDIIRLRSDARMDDSGFELTSIVTEPLISAPYPLRTSFAKASEFFSAAGAISCRIGADPGADAKYQQWLTRYQNEIRGAR